MALYALVSPDDQVLEYRDADAPAVTPHAHKPRLIPVVGTPPTFDPVREALSGPVEQVEAEQVVRVYSVGPRPLEDRKAEMKAAVTAKRDEILSGGYAHDFGAPHGVKVLQTRPEDRTNWLTSQASYSAAVAAGQGEVVGATFRAEDDTMIVLSYAEGLSVLLAMAAWGQGVYSQNWTLKDQIGAAETHEALDAIDIDAGWPV